MCARRAHNTDPSACDSIAELVGSRDCPDTSPAAPPPLTTDIEAEEEEEEAEAEAEAPSRREGWSPAGNEAAPLGEEPAMR